jgi:hypothetical protein
MVDVLDTHTDVPVPENGGRRPGSLLAAFRSLAIGHSVDINWTGKPVGIYSTAARAAIKVKVRTELIRTTEGETKKVLRIWRIK